MPAIAAPATYAMVAWWFTTGLILLLDGLPRRTFAWSMAGATVLLLVCAYILPINANDATVSGAYIGFTCAISIWGWLEMSFLMGFITGPRKHACAARCTGWRHFLHAIQAIIYNEIATLIVAAGIFVITRHGANQIALWTYVILWSMRVSAKLNLFFGVPNLGEKFLPPHLEYLKSFFRKRTMNWLFPLSITGSTAATVLLMQKYLAAMDPFRIVGYSLLVSLLALAVLEHWFMVIPLPSERLWRWALRSGSDSRDEHKLEQRIAVKAP
jgi:putative photosynthetic complex assembly protein 2